MKASELRIGNLVLYENPHGDRIKTIVDYKVFLYADKLEPIPLTEELLLKCGFEKHRDSYIDDILPFDISWINQCWTLSYDTEFCTSYFCHDKIEYLHQLQNIYFALTNEELKIEL